MRAAFPKAECPPDPALEAQILLPDPGDAHVVAGATRGEAAVILTFNLRDFPRRVLAGHGIAARHPDEFLWECLSQDPERVRPIVQSVLESFELSGDEARAALKRARLPRFAKAWVAGG